MREELDTVPIDGTIVIGEGERDEAPMLYIGEKVGMAAQGEVPWGTLPRSTSPSIRSRARTSAPPARPNAIAVLAASEQGGLLHAPDLYMEKLVVGPQLQATRSSLDAPVARQPAGDRPVASSRDVEDLVVIVLDRPRHEKLIADIRATGARIRLIGDGDLSAGIAAAVVGTGVHAVMGTGGAPEGVLTAAAMRCLNGEIFARLVVTQARSTRSAAARWASPTSSGSTRRRTSRPGDDIIFAATGVTDGTLMKGVRFFGDGIAHELARHAERAAPDPLHRHASTSSSRRREDPVLSDATVPHVG